MSTMQKTTGWQVVRQRIVLVMAMFWGLAAFLPVGMNYLALVLMLLALLVHGGLAQRLQRVRSHAVFWPMVIFVVVTLAALALQDRMYPETPANLMHGARIVLTLALALSLTRLEARAAVVGVAGAFLGVALMLASFHAGLLPSHGFWMHLTHPSTNKSISAAIVCSMLAAAATSLSVSARGWHRVMAMLVFAVALLVIFTALEQRTAVLGYVLSLLAIAIHQWRGHPVKLGAGVLAVSVFAAGLYTAMPELRQRLDQGATEVQSALDGKVELASWNIRIQMIRHTSDMMWEKPVTGWGVGAWNTQWRERVPDMLDGFNMPHNDLLWMGSQAGLPGALAWLVLMLSTCWAAWRERHWAGRAAFALGVIATFSALVNSATRDATLGLPMLWLLGVMLAYARSGEPQSASAASRGASLEDAGAALQR